MNRSVSRALALLPLLAAAPASGAAEEPPPVGSVAIGDFTGDGKPDIAVALSRLQIGGAEKAGEVRVYSGTTARFLWKVSGDNANQRLGSSIAAVGDVDKDGATDLAISSPLGDGAYIDFVSGRTGKSIFRTSGGDCHAWGDVLCPLGDGSGKVRVDLAARWVQGKVWRYVYTDKEAVGSLVFDDGGGTTRAASVGDVDGDGAADFAICDYDRTVDGLKGAGAVRVISGRHLRHSEEVPRSEILLLRGARENENFGIAVAGAGDWDKDGRADIVSGVAGRSGSKTSSWLVRIFSGKNGTELWSAAGDPGDRSMNGVAVVGDVDGDGCADVAVARRGTGDNAGAVSLHSSKDSAAIWSVQGADGEQLGQRMCLMPDTDGDRIGDLLVLAPGSAVKGVQGAGYVRILSGKSGALIRSINPLVAK